ncbi:hypothetical protein [Janthinobacterium tructae]|jgi:hypothetical protein|uniref:hypothetical protein n=1 Tax=Janthinobacterium tructae TaxID=2590869 RepID=UPI00249BA49E|nr:hypothetical protein [Janthinobacterium tructae]MDI3295406.1 hypothetical protein [Janthinobacterium tructae]
MNAFDPITLANRRAKGKRPQFLDDPAVERVLSIAVAVATELAVLRERVDTIERLLEKNGSLVRADIENFRDPQAHVERSQWQKEYVARIFRMLQQDREALEDADESSMEAIAAELAADDGTAQA